MARRKTHTERWWDAAAPHILRCTGHNKTDGSRCRAEAEPGTTVCWRHGAAIPAVQAAAATRIQMSVDEAAQRLIEWLNDNDVDMRERVKIAHDLLDRGGLGATSKHLVGVVSGDPVETLFRDILSDPDGLAPAAPALAAPPVPDAAQAALDAQQADPDWDAVLGREIGSDDADDVVDAELVEDSGADSPPHTVQVAPYRTPKHIRDDLRRLGLL